MAWRWCVPSSWSTAASCALGVLWVRETFPQLIGYALALHLPYASAAVALGLTLVVSLVAALGPARRAARLQPAVALRYE